MDKDSFWPRRRRLPPPLATNTGVLTGRRLQANDWLCFHCPGTAGSGAYGFLQEPSGGRREGGEAGNPNCLSVVPSLSSPGERPEENILWIKTRDGLTSFHSKVDDELHDGFVV